jgi:hypothetical protein
MQSVTINGGQVLSTFLLGMLLCYCYAVLGTNFGWDSYNFGGQNGGNWETLYDSFWQHLDFGLRDPPTFYEFHNVPKYIFDISYNVLVVIIMVAIM